MTAIAHPAVPRLLRGIGIRQVRITCGLILFTYLLSHFANHALGNISYAAMEDGLDYHMRFWRNPFVTAVFYGAAITHWSLGLWALYERRQFRYKAPEITQLVLGLSIPFLLIIHFTGARLQSPLFGRDLYYAQALTAYLVSRPYMEWVQFTLLIAAPYLLAAAVLLPTLALLGLAQGGREVTKLARQTEWRASNLAPARLATPPQRAVLDALARIAVNVDQLNRDLAHDLREPIRYAIGVNGGEVIIGDVGYRDQIVFTALGDPVNVAARLQDMTKSLGCDVVVAEDVCRRAGLAPDPDSTREVPIRRRDAAMAVRVVRSAHPLSGSAAT